MVEMEEERLRMREHVMNEVGNFIQGPIYRTAAYTYKRAQSSIALILSKSSNIISINNRFLLTKLFAPAPHRWILTKTDWSL